MLQDVFYTHLKRARNRRTGNERRTYGRLGLPRGFRHGLDSDRRIFSIKIHPTCRLNPSLLLMANIEDSELQRSRYAPASILAYDSSIVLIQDTRLRIDPMHITHSHKVGTVLG